jgi:cell wall-associated protease
MKCKKRIIFLLVTVVAYFNPCDQILVAQNVIYNSHGWQFQDYRIDSIYGAGITKAYDELLRDKKAKQVIVAVIDNGIDTAHAALSSILWTNKNDIPGNGIDDDKNGYIDDTHGWNFLGGKNGENITVESLESYREYYRISSDGFIPKTSEGNPDTAYITKVKTFCMRDSASERRNVNMLSQVIPQMQSADSLLKYRLGKNPIYVRDVMEFEPRDTAFSTIKKNTLLYFKKYGISPDMSLGKFIIEAEKYLESSRIKLTDFSNDPNALRKKIVGDHYNDLSDNNYGNNNISAGNPSHGTHVAGIIAAQNQNENPPVGIDKYVKIMVLRAVPDGDERDKDIALAIRYAVDNGARIINMSFGKYFSPEEKWVDEAVAYAEAKNVLLIHAAGNEMRDIDSIPHYPDPFYGKSKAKSDSYITVGASTGGPDSILLVRSSNYGKNQVDLFAPGVKIYSTVTDNQYAAYSGTSMAAAVVSGIAALILEYYPGLSARQIKSILMQSVTKPIHSMVRSSVPGKRVDFTELSVSGGIVNAYNALLLASQTPVEKDPIR